MRSNAEYDQTRSHYAFAVVTGVCGYHWAYGHALPSMPNPAVLSFADMRRFLLHTFPRASPEGLMIEVCVGLDNAERTALGDWVEMSYHSGLILLLRSSLNTEIVSSLARQVFNSDEMRNEYSKVAKMQTVLATHPYLRDLTVEKVAYAYKIPYAEAEDRVYGPFPRPTRHYCIDPAAGGAASKKETVYGNFDDSQ